MSANDAAADPAQLLLGAVDLHAHPGPSPFPRRFGIAEAAHEAAAAGFRAIAVKSHHHSMVSDVSAIQSATGPFPIEVLSGVALNNQVGGLNPYAVELALTQGGRIVWFPTISASNHIAKRGALQTFPNSVAALRPASPVPVTTDDGALAPEVMEILRLIRDHDAVLSCGHLSADEIDLLLPAAFDVGVRRAVVNHPNFVVDADPERCARWAEQGAYIEHSLCHYDPRSTFHKWGLDVLLGYVQQTGANHSILSSDLGQIDNPTPTEAFLAIVERLVAADVPPATIRQLVAGSASAVID